jgi:DNA-binding NtrC family response regulator
MSEHIFALLIHEEARIFESLRKALRDLGVNTYSVATCQDARDLITQCQPQIVFTERRVSDGTWQTILRMADAAAVPLSLIVVAPHPDTRFYLSVMEEGAFDFVAPPFEHESLKFVVHSAEMRIRYQRRAVSVAATA